MATFVLIHGGGHGGWCYAKVAARLHDRSHRVFAPSLTGLGDRSHLLSPDIDLDTHVQDVVQLLHHEDLRDVVLVGHSYGGMVITGVADRAADRIGKLVYLDAANPKDGESLVDVAGPMMNAARQLGEVRDGIELVLLPDAESGRFYGVQDDADVAWMADRLTPHPWRCFDTPLRLADPARVAAIPTFHVVCEETIPTRDPEMIESARDAGRLYSIDTGHDLMITEPDFVANAFDEIASK